MALGADDYLNKPLKANHLLQKSRKILHESDQSFSYKFVEKPAIQWQVKGQLIGMNEELFMIETVVSCAQGKGIEVVSPILEECGLKKQILRTGFRSLASDNPGTYSTKLKLLGLSADVNQKLASIVKDWK